MTKLVASFETAPRIKAKEGGEEWHDVENYRLATAEQLIASTVCRVELRGAVSLTREELQSICDQAKPKRQLSSNSSTMSRDSLGSNLAWPAPTRRTSG